MMSTFDLTLLGMLVCAGGFLFLRQGKSRYCDSRWFKWLRPSGLTLESRAHHERSTEIAGVRWLTVGALALFLAYAHGTEADYLFGPWTDVMFHVVFVASCWSMTAFRIKQAAERSSVALSDSSRN